MLARWIAFGCSAIALAGIAGAQTFLFSDGFENGLSNWTPSGLWTLVADTDPCGVQATPFPDGNSAAWYGVPGACNYDTGAANTGALLLAQPVAIPAGVPAAKLYLWTRQNTEYCTSGTQFADQLTLLASGNGGANWQSVGTSCVKVGYPQTWTPRGIDLSAYIGGSVLLSIVFNTNDAFENSGAGVYVDRIEIRVEAGTVFCAGGCPCAGPFQGGVMGGNSYGNVSGCTNSERREGELAGDGTPSVASDTLVLRATELLGSTIALLLQSDATPSAQGSVFGDGRLCLVGTIAPIAIHATASGSVAFPSAGDPPLSVAGLVPAAGATRSYQVVYRDPSAYCGTARFNATNGYRIAWTP